VKRKRLSEKQSFRVSLSLVGFALAILVVALAMHNTMVSLSSARKQKKVSEKSYLEGQKRQQEEKQSWERSHFN
jgi:cysteine sulfinate desulfinase/cysteine desulfurase-like protein